MSELIIGVLVLNLVFTLVGYCALATFLRGSSAATWISFAGVGLLVGAGLIGLILGALAVAGAPASVSVFGATAVGLALSGVGAATRPAASRVNIRFRPPPARADSPVHGWIASIAAGAVVAICFLVVVAGFRSSPWLDDAWTFWLPKGVALSTTGLDERLFVPNDDFVSFTSPHYPLWWSLVGGLDVAAVGRIDLRAVNAQLALLHAAFAAAATRLLWGHVRPTILLPAILLAAAAPELVAQTQSGGADVPLALYIALAVVSSALWLRHSQRLFLALAFIFVATALNTKDEASGLVLVLLLGGGCFAWKHAPRNVAMLGGAVAAAFLAVIPWLAWTAAHDVGSEAIGADAFSPAHLWEERDRLGPAARAVAREALHPRGWFLPIPLLIAASAAVAVRERRLVWLAPPLMTAAALALLVWVYWAGSVDLTFWLETSAYRVVDSVVVAAAVAWPLVAEHAIPGDLAQEHEHPDVFTTQRV